MSEVWKAIDGYYQVSNLGEVRNGNGVILKKWKKYKTYYVKLHGENRMVAHLVFLHFGDVEEFNIAHITWNDEDRFNNRIDNLFLMSPEERLLMCIFGENPKRESNSLTQQGK